MCSSCLKNYAEKKEGWRGVELEEAKAGFPRVEGSRDRINPSQKNPSIIRCNGSEETVAFGCDFIRLSAQWLI